MALDSIRVVGVYDQRTLDYLISLGIVNFGFDFYPKSLNFLQQHIFLEMVEKSFSSKHNYYLHFQGEIPEMVNKFIDDLREQFGEEKIKNRFGLEFLDERDADYYDGFNSYFGWHYSPGNLLQELLRSKNIKSLTLDHEYLEMLQRSGTLFSFLKELVSMIEGRDIRLQLRISWGDDLIASLFDFFSFSQILINIDPRIEAGYRQVDFDKLTDQLQFLAAQMR